MFVDNLPGFPDNIRYDGEGHYWIALASVCFFMSFIFDVFNLASRAVSYFSDNLTGKDIFMGLGTKVPSYQKNNCYTCQVCWTTKGREKCWCFICGFTRKSSRTLL